MMASNVSAEESHSSLTAQQQQQRRSNRPRDDVIPRLQSPVHRHQRLALSTVDAVDIAVTPPRSTTSATDPEGERDKTTTRRGFVEGVATASSAGVQPRQLDRPAAEGPQVAAGTMRSSLGRGDEGDNNDGEDDDGFVPVTLTSSAALGSFNGVGTATATARLVAFTSGFLEDDGEGLSHPLESPAAAASSTQEHFETPDFTRQAQRAEFAASSGPTTVIDVVQERPEDSQPQLRLHSHARRGSPHHQQNNVSSSSTSYHHQQYPHGPKASPPPPPPASIGRQHRFSAGDSGASSPSPAAATAQWSTATGNSNANSNNSNSSNVGVGGRAIDVVRVAHTGQPLLPKPRKHVSSENWGTVTRFGFPKSEYEHIAEAERASRRLADDAAALCDKMWASALRGVPLLANATDETSAPLRNLVRKYGIPPHLRGILWLTLSGVALTPEENEQFCHTLLDTYGAYVDAATSDAIEKDLDRTFPDHPYFAHDDIGQTKLRRVLHALCSRNPVLGYCQSFNFLAGIILLVMEDEEATFWFMCFLLETVLPNDCYDRSLTGIKVDQEVVLVLVEDLFPRLAAHFSAVRFDVRALVPAWLLSIFVNTFPMETAVRIWDVMITRSGGDGSLSAGSGGKGANHVSQRVSGRSALPISVLLAFLKWHHDALLALDDAGEMMQYLTHAASTCFDKEKLVHMALAVQLSPLQLHQLRRQKRIQLRRQEADKRRGDRPAAVARGANDHAATATANSGSTTDAHVNENGTGTAAVADDEPPSSPFSGSDTDAYRRMATDWAAEAPRHAEEDLLLARQDTDTLVEMRELTTQVPIESQ